MKNVLKHSNGSQSLLANVDDDTNRIFINDAEIPSSLWVGSGTYTQSIDGVMISITKISDLSGNIMLQKVSDNHYQLVRKTEAASIPFSHIGQIIESTTLDSLDKVQAIYGSNTMWIQHTGYMLRGATSGVTAGSATKTGGADSVSYTPAGTNGNVGSTKLTAAQSGVPSHRHDVGPKATGDVVFTKILQVASGTSYSVPADWGSGLRADYNTAQNASEGHTHSGSTFTGTKATINTLPQYKNVYIWERTA